MARKKLPHESETFAGDYLPYGSLMTHNIVRLPGAQGYLAVVKLHGTPFAMSSNKDINTLSRKLSLFYKSIGSPQVSFWINVVRRKFTKYASGEFPLNSFSEQLNNKYRKKIEEKNLRVNEIYISLLYQPDPNIFSRSLTKLFSSFSEEDHYQTIQQQIEEMNVLISRTLQSLGEYHPDLLTSYEHEDQLYSELGEFLHFLYNHKDQRIPVTPAELKKIIPGNRVLFHDTGAITIKDVTKVAMIGATLAPERLTAIALSDLLQMPCDLVITHSISFMDKNEALEMMRLRRVRMENAADKAVSQIEEIAEAEDDVASDRLSFGEYHFSVAVYDEKYKYFADIVHTFLNRKGFKVHIFDKVAAAAYLAQMPGNFSFRPNVLAVSNENFAQLCPLHNYPIGRYAGAQWEHPIALLPTTANTPFFLNFHVHESGGYVDQDKVVDPDHREAANAIIFGKTGSGKTTFVAFLVTMMLKFWDRGNKPYLNLIFDLDMSQANMVRANGGRYFVIKNGFNSGFQPMQLPPTPSNRDLVYSLLQICMNCDEIPLSITEEAQLRFAVDSVMNEQIPLSSRRISSLLEFLNQEEEGGLFYRLLPWTQHGPKGWIFDNPTETIDIEGVPIVGFELKEVFENLEYQEVITFYLLQRADLLMDGRRFPLVVEELGQLALIASISRYFEKKLVRIRKHNAFILGIMQHPGQARGTIFERSLASQTTTQIYFSDKRAAFDDYVHLMKTTKAEYMHIRAANPLDRLVLIKQGDDSTVISFDLSGLEDEISILSSNPDSAKRVENLIKEKGENPAEWLPIHYQTRRVLANIKESQHEEV